MKTFLTILASVLFCSVFFTPTEDAPLSTYFLWLVWVVGALVIVNLIFKEVARWNEEDKKK